MNVRTLRNNSVHNSCIYQKTKGLSEDFLLYSLPKSLGANKSLKISIKIERVEESQGEIWIYGEEQSSLTFFRFSYLFLFY